MAFLNGTSDCFGTPIRAIDALCHDEDILSFSCIMSLFEQVEETYVV